LVEVIKKGYDLESDMLQTCWDELKQIEKIIATIIIKLKAERATSKF